MTALPFASVHAVAEPGLVATAEVIGRDVAGPAADDVDRDARFPHESIAALRDAGLFGALVPTRFGGAGCSYAELTAMCTALGRYCSSTAMVFAMHQIQVACVVDYGQGIPHFDDFLREIASAGRLIASATTEAATGGDVRSSACAVEYSGDAISLTKDASVISYGEYVDDVLVTARRNPAATVNDQVIVHVAKPNLILEPSGDWDTLGMRGTRSIGFMLHATGTVDDIIPTPYSEVSGATMLPVSHLTWAALWLGIAEASMERARAFVRAAARKTPGQVPLGARHLGRASAVMARVRALIDAAVDEYECTRANPDRASSMTFALHMNNLKLAVSSDVLEIVQTAMTICGIAGYRNDSSYSIGRLLRDANSAPLMVHNDRILEHNATLLCLVKDA